MGPYQIEAVRLCALAVVDAKDTGEKGNRDHRFTALAIPIARLGGGIVSAALHTAEDGGAVFCLYRYSRSEEHTSELQSLMRISYAVICLTTKIHMNLHQTRPTR